MQAAGVDGEDGEMKLGRWGSAGARRWSRQRMRHSRFTTTHLSKNMIEMLAQRANILMAITGKWAIRGSR